MSRDARSKPRNSALNHTETILDEEQQDRVDRCLPKATPAASTAVSRRLIRQIERAMDAFLADMRGYSMTDREVRDYIRRLWHLANELDPSIGQIRALSKSAPDRVARKFDPFAPRDIPQFYGTTGMPTAEEQALCSGGFRAWAAIAGSEALIWAIRTLPRSSGVVAVRRSRGAGKLSQLYLEPYIDRIARGADSAKPSGGRRPYLDFKFLLIGRLATALERATGKFPSPGRSDKTGFGDLVHSVFQWLGMEGQAEYALRQYWKEFARS
jgi:hypothetical protein